MGKRINTLQKEPNPKDFGEVVQISLVRQEKEAMQKTLNKGGAVKVVGFSAFLAEEKSGKNIHLE